MITDADLFEKVQNSRLRTLARIKKTPEAAREEREVSLLKSLAHLKKPKRVRVSMPPYAPRVGNPPCPCGGTLATVSEDENIRILRCAECGAADVQYKSKDVAAEAKYLYTHPSKGTMKRLALDRRVNPSMLVIGNPLTEEEQNQLMSKATWDARAAKAYMGSNDRKAAYHFGRAVAREEDAKLYGPNPRNPLTKVETAELETDAAEEHKRGMQLIEDGQVEEGSLHMGKSIMAEEVGMRYGNPRFEIDTTGRMKVGLPPIFSKNPLIVALLSGSYQNIINPREAVFFGTDGEVAALVSIHIPATGGNEVFIDTIRADRSGGGGSVLQLLCDRADQHSITLRLDASPFKTGQEWAKMTKGKLIAWYKTFGFIQVSGGLMIRRPGAIPKGTLPVIHGGGAMNLKTAKAHLAPLGISINWKASTAEFRVNFVDGKEGTAYYTNDLRDAVGTGEAMAQEGRKGNPPLLVLGNPFDPKSGRMKGPKVPLRSLPVGAQFYSPRVGIHTIFEVVAHSEAGTVARNTDSGAEEIFNLHLKVHSRDPRFMNPTEAYTGREFEAGKPLWDELDEREAHALLAMLRENHIEATVVVAPDPKKFGAHTFAVYLTKFDPTDTYVNLGLHGVVNRFAMALSEKRIMHLVDVPGVQHGGGKAYTGAGRRGRRGNSAKSKFTLTKNTHDLKYGILYDGRDVWWQQKYGGFSIVEAETYENAMEALRNSRRQEREGIPVDKIDPWAGVGRHGRMRNPAKFLTKADLKHLPPIGSQESKGDEAVAWVKLFTPWTSWTWYMTEFDPATGEAFGLVQGHESEAGYFSIPELQEIRGPGGLRIERDLYFKPTTISQLRRGGNPVIITEEGDGSRHAVAYNRKESMRSLTKELNKPDVIRAEYSTTYDLAQDVNGRWIILVNGFQWGAPYDRSGAGSAEFGTKQEALDKVSDLMRGYHHGDERGGNPVTTYSVRHHPERKGWTICISPAPDWAPTGCIGWYKRKADAISRADELMRGGNPTVIIPGRPTIAVPSSKRVWVGHRIPGVPIEVARAGAGVTIHDTKKRRGNPAPSFVVINAKTGEVMYSKAASGTGQGALTNAMEAAQRLADQTGNLYYVFLNMMSSVKKGSRLSIPMVKMQGISATVGPRIVKGGNGRAKNPQGVPANIENDPKFQRELAAYRRRHKSDPVHVTAISVPKGYPKYMSVYGEIPEAKYDAPMHSVKGKRVHHFGKRGKNRPYLASSTEKGPKFLAIVGGTFKAKTDWLHD